MAEKLEELKRLPAEERIRRLRELTEKDKKEIEEAQSLLKESETEAQEKKKEIDKIPIPQLKSVDIDSLFGEEEKQVFEAKRFVGRGRRIEEAEEEHPRGRRGESLEEGLAGVPRLPEEQREAIRQEYIRQETTRDLYERRAEIYQGAGNRGISEREREYVNIINQEFEERRRAIEEGSYRTSEEVQEMLGLSRRVGKYKR